MGSGSCKRQKGSGGGVAAVQRRPGPGADPALCACWAARSPTCPSPGTGIERIFLRRARRRVTMLICTQIKNQLAVRRREPLTSGSVNVYQVRFEFSPDWEGLERTACSGRETESRSVPLDDSGVCEIPWECWPPRAAVKRRRVRHYRGAVFGAAHGLGGPGGHPGGRGPRGASRPPTPSCGGRSWTRRGCCLGL